MMFKPAFLVSYLSSFMSQQPGDAVTTGTPRSSRASETPSALGSKASVSNARGS
jgi:2,4-diketo-3-deoxy-L-fuconate hydrolase